MCLLGKMAHWKDWSLKTSTIFAWELGVSAGQISALFYQTEIRELFRVAQLREFELTSWSQAKG